jgi:hypothetical protein
MQHRPTDARPDLGTARERRRDRNLAKDGDPGGAAVVVGLRPLLPRLELDGPHRTTILILLACSYGIRTDNFIGSLF